MKDKNLITATQSALMLQDHIDKKYEGNVMLFCAKTGNDLRNTTAMLSGARPVSEAVMSVFTKKATKNGQRLNLKPKKHRSYYFTWEPSRED